MNKEYIEFKQERDLGTIITDAFKFIRIEGKDFFTTILKITAIPIAITIFAMVYMFFSMGNLHNDNPFDAISFGGSSLIMMIAYLVTIIFINLSGMYYIKSYIDNKGNVNFEEVKTNSKNKFWSFFGFGVLAFIILFISVMLCVFPVFYTMTVLSLGASILVFENVSGADAIGRSFTFINGHFWETLGVILLVGILVSILGTIFQIPVIIYQFIQIGLIDRSGDTAQFFGVYQDPVYLILNVISAIGKFMFYSITLITNVFLYFDINEQKNLTGTIEKIDSIGQ